MGSDAAPNHLAREGRLAGKPLLDYLSSCCEDQAYASETDYASLKTTFELETSQIRYEYFLILDSPHFLSFHKHQLIDHLTDLISVA